MKTGLSESFVESAGDAWRIESEYVSEDVYRYRIIDGDPLSYRKVAGFWQDRSFADWFSRLLRSSRFDAFFWECRPVTASSIDDPFEFVLIRAPALAAATPEPRAFEERFSDADGRDVVVFPNLGGDAILVAPKPSGLVDTYPHLAAFVRGAGEGQQRRLWEAVGMQVAERIGTRPLWVSTSGLGVYWLHVRLDSRPKYYQFREYRNTPRTRPT